MKTKCLLGPRLSKHLLAIIYCTSASVIYDLIKEENFDGPQIAFSPLSILFLRFHCHNISKNLLPNFNAPATLTYSGIKSRPANLFSGLSLNPIGFPNWRTEFHYILPIHNEPIELKDLKVRRVSYKSVYFIKEVRVTPKLIKQLR